MVTLRLRRIQLFLVNEEPTADDLVENSIVDAPLEKATAG